MTKIEVKVKFSSVFLKIQYVTFYCFVLEICFKSYLNVKKYSYGYITTESEVSATDFSKQKYFVIFLKLYIYRYMCRKALQYTCTLLLFNDLWRKSEHV